MNGVFSGAQTFNTDLSSWDVSNVSSMEAMFAGAATFNQNISVWDTSNVTNMTHTFWSAQSFNQNIGSFNMSNVAAAGDMLSDSGITRANYDLTLKGWSAQSLQSNVQFDSEAKYCTAEPQRQQIITSFNWSISDGGRECGVTRINGGLSVVVYDNKAIPQGILGDLSTDYPANVAYSLTCATPGANDGLFQIGGASANKLMAATTVASGEYAVCVRANGSSGGYVEQNLTVKVVSPIINNLNHTCVLLDDNVHEIGISLANFETTSTADLRVKFGDNAMSNLRANGDNTYITVDVPTEGLEPGLVDVTVWDANDPDYTVTLSDAFQYLAPSASIDEVSPASLALDGGVHDVYIVALGFALSDPEDLRVFFGANEVAITNVNDNDIMSNRRVLTVSVPTDGISRGYVDVTVTDSARSYLNTTSQDGFLYIAGGEAAVTGIEFVSQDDESLMVVTGQGFGEDFSAAVTQSMVSLNGRALPFCADGTGSTATELIGYGIDASLVSDDLACYFILGDHGADFGADPQSMTIWLPNGFDTAAQGTVSINGSDNFIFNEQQGNDEAILISGASGSLDATPVIPATPTFSGRTTPGARVRVTVHSDPVICETTADSNGDWSCTLPSALPAGSHTVYVRVTRPDTTVEEFGPYAVTVASQGATITSNTPLAPNSAVGTPGSSPRHSYLLLVIAPLSYCPSPSWCVCVPHIKHRRVAGISLSWYHGVKRGEINICLAYIFNINETYM